MKHEALKFLRNCSPLQDIGDDDETILAMLIKIIITPLLKQILAYNFSKFKPVFLCRPMCLDTNTQGNLNYVDPKSVRVLKP